MNQSHFQVVCECGKTVETAAKHTTCPHCGRELDLSAWQVEHTRTAQGVMIHTPAAKVKPQ